MPTITIKCWNKYIQCQQSFYSSQMKAFLCDIDYHLQFPYQKLKEGSNSTVVVVKIDEQYFVVKRINFKSKIHQLRLQLSQSRAQKNWHNALKLLSVGIKTFYPIALLEKRFGPFKGHSFLIYPYINGTDLINYISSNIRSPHNLENVAHSIRNMLDHLMKHRITHRDLNLNNILIVDNQAWLIDLDTMRLHWWRYWANRRSQRDLARFMRNWERKLQASTETAPLFNLIFSNNC